MKEEDKKFNEWLNGNELGINIVKKKYVHDDESFDEWINRISGGDESVKQLILDKKFLFGGRILANRGLAEKGVKCSLSNCYVLNCEDSIESIYKLCGEMARTYSYGGGVGIDISNLRPNGALVNNSAKTTSGAVSFMKTFDNVTGTIGIHGRRGALMISIDVRHPDVEEFINIKANTIEITNANISIRVNNDFMNAVVKNEDFLLRWPCSTKNELTKEECETLKYGVLTYINGVYYKKINAEKLFRQIARNNWNYGEPGVLFWDNIENKHLMSASEDFKYAGVNPCVSGDTMVLTDNGYKRIDSMVGKETYIWNGFEFSKVVPMVTGYNQEMLLVKFSNGSSISCTKYHKFVLEGGIRVEAKDLKAGDVIANFRTIESEENMVIADHEYPGGEQTIHRGIKVESVMENGICDKVYCFNESINHTAIFNGIITGQCGEEPLPDGCACLLGSMNLSQYVTDKGVFNENEFASDVRLATKALNQVLDEGIALHPLEKQRKNVEKWHQIGLGLFDLSGQLIKMKVKYGTEVAKKIAERVTHLMLINAFEASCDLNVEGFEYPGMFNSVFYKTRVLPFIDEKYIGKYPRNSQLLTIAPTGTTSTMINASSGGGEPIFALSYIRATKSMEDKDGAYKVYPQVVLDYFNGNVDDVDLEKLPDYFISAETIEWADRIDMQSALQKNIDASISSTVNLRENVTVDDIFNLYVYAWEKNLKGVTVFRENCRRVPILSRGTQEKSCEFNTTTPPKRPKTLEADFYQVKANGENFCVFVGLYDGKPYELFAVPSEHIKISDHKGKITKVKKMEYRFDSDLFSMDNIGSIDKEYRNVTLHVSAALRHGMPIKSIVALENKCNDSIVSFNKAISRVLNKYVPKEVTNEECPECRESLIRENGCLKCPSCGYSRCE